jgi:hypothetical protein
VSTEIVNLELEKAKRSLRRFLRFFEVEIHPWQKRVMEEALAKLREPNE